MGGGGDLFIGSLKHISTLKAYVDILEALLLLSGRWEPKLAKIAWNEPTDISFGGPWCCVGHATTWGLSSSCAVLNDFSMDFR